MKFFVMSVIAVMSFLLLWGCGSNAPRNFNVYVDLDSDGTQELISGDYGKRHWHYADYDLTAKFSNPSDGYQEPKLIMRFKGRPAQINFTDLDGDGDVDLVFSRYGKRYWTYTDYDTYIVRNDGSGNFGKPELILRQGK